MAEEITKQASKTENAAIMMANRLVEEIEKVVVGKHNEVVLLVTALLSGTHVLVEDVPGVGKTTLASAIAKAAGLQFKRAQFTPDVMASDITGFNMYNRKTEEFEFHEGLAMTNIMLADEINRASPKTQSALLEAMEEHKVTVDGVSYPMPEPFMVIATQNPSGFVGTYPLPEAQLDRFAMKLSMGYPSAKEEINIIADRRIEDPSSKIETVANANVLEKLRTEVKKVHIDDAIYAYIVALVSATRSSEYLTLGSSPRGSLALMKTAQAYAFMMRREYVLPEDVAVLYKKVIAHRITLRQEAKLNKITANDVLDDILRRTEAPYLGKK
ncbi:MAG: MoxR family ATPase [Clostridia bacterium]|nr:MoxR family ATPase [Clostridia bacterium]